VSATWLAVRTVTMGCCSEEHQETWATFWYGHCGVANESLLKHSQEGTDGWWGRTSFLGTVILAGGSARGSLVTDFKLLVACHLLGWHLVRFIKIQPGSLRGLTETDVG